MLPSDEEKAYIVSYCKTDGSGNSACSKCDKESHQPNCSFYEQGSFSTRCSHIRMGEYCSNFYACDFSDGKPVDTENIPNMPKMARHIKQFINTQEGMREIYKDQEYYGHRRNKEYEKCDTEIDHEKLHKLATFVSNTIGEQNKEEEKPLPTIGADGFLKFINMEIEDAFAVPASLLESNPCAEVAIAVDTSGTMTPEKFLELSAIVAETLRDQTLCIFKPVTKSVTQEHLSEAYDAFCAAYSEKYGLFLDMTDPNLYTIYNSMGKFMSLRTLLNDKITPFDLDFKMKGGNSCFEEYGFEEFVEQIEQMLVQGR